MTTQAQDGKPYAGNPHVLFDEGEVALAATPRRGSLLYKIIPFFAILGTTMCCGCATPCKIVQGRVREQVNVYLVERRFPELSLLTPVELSGREGKLKAFEDMFSDTRSMPGVDCNKEELRSLLLDDHADILVFASSNENKYLFVSYVLTPLLDDDSDASERVRYFYSECPYELATCDVKSGKMVGFMSGGVEMADLLNADLYPFGAEGALEGVDLEKYEGHTWVGGPHAL